MIFQVKGISGHQWVCVECARVCTGMRLCVRVCGGVCGYARVCMGVHGCVWVCADVSRCTRVCAGVREYERVCAGMHRCAQVCLGVRVCTRMCVGVRGYAWVCMGMQRFAHVCGMNFQNFFRRIESLHQRTLIRILYEFYLLIFIRIQPTVHLMLTVFFLRQWSIWLIHFTKV